MRVRLSLGLVMNVFKILMSLSFFFVVMAIFSLNAVYSIMSFVFLIVTIACMLLLLEVEFLAYSILLIYVGAIAVLFLFVMMMLQLGKTNTKSRALTASVMIYFVLLLKVVFFIFYYNYQLNNLLSLFSYSFINFNFSVYTFSTPLMIAGDSIIFLNLFTQKYIFFVLIGITLLFSMFGAITLCLLNKPGFLKGSKSLK